MFVFLNKNLFCLRISAARSIIFFCKHKRWWQKRYQWMSRCFAIFGACATYKSTKESHVYTPWVRNILFKFQKLPENSYNVFAAVLEDRFQIECHHLHQSCVEYQFTQIWSFVCEIWWWNWHNMRMCDFTTCRRVALSSNFRRQ